MTDLSSLSDHGWVGPPPPVEDVEKRARALVRRQRTRKLVAGVAVVALVGAGVAVAALRDDGQDRLVPGGLISSPACPETFTGPSSSAPGAATRLFPPDTDAFTVCTYDDSVNGSQAGRATLRLEHAVALDDVKATATAFNALRRDPVQLRCLLVHQHRVLVVGAQGGSVTATVALRDPCSTTLSNGRLITEGPDHDLDLLLGLDLGRGTNQDRYQVVGTLLDDHFGAPVAGTTITLAHSAGADVGTAETDSEGRWVAYLPPGSYDATADSPDGSGCAVPHPIVVRPNTVTEATLGCPHAFTGGASPPPPATTTCPAAFSEPADAAATSADAVFAPGVTAYSVCYYGMSELGKHRGLPPLREGHVVADVDTLTKALVQLEPGGAQRACLRSEPQVLVVATFGSGSQAWASLTGSCGIHFSNGGYEAIPTAQAISALGEVEGLSPENFPVAVTGTFDRVGGPYPGSPVPLSGTVSFAQNGGKRDVDVVTGTFTAVLPAGTYTVTGTSPALGARPCSSPLALTVPRGGPASVKVVCSVP